MSEYARVQKWIALSGFCGRKNAEKLIEKGQVKVNDLQVSLGDHCYYNDKISVSGKVIRVPVNDFNYIVLNKPRGVITSKSDKQGRKKILDLLNSKDYKDNLFPVGRLDMNTTGLIVITNDGPFAQSFLHPSSNTSKTYSVVLDKPLSSEDKVEIENGVELEEGKLAGCRVESLGERIYKVVIFEGKNRQIRRMFHAYGYRVVKLERTNIGNLSLSKLGLKPGSYRIVTKSFLEKMIKG